MVSFGRNRYSFYCLIKHAFVLSSGKHKWKWCRGKHVPRYFHWMCCVACLTSTSWMQVSWAAQQVIQFSWFLFSALRTLLSYFQSKTYQCYTHSFFMVHDLFLVFSVSMVGFYALWGSGFVKHDIFICTIFAGLKPYLCYLFPLFSFGCDNDFYVGRSTEREGRRSKQFPPSLASLGPSWCREARNWVDLATDSIFLEWGLYLAHLKTTWLLFCPSFLTMHAQDGESVMRCGQRTPQVLTGLNGPMGAFTPSHPSLVHLGLGSQPQLNWAELQNCKGPACSSAASGCGREAGAQSLQPVLL